MSTATEQNKAILRRYFEEVYNRGNLDALDELIAPDYVAHLAASSPYREIRGRDAQRGYIAAARTMLPDFHITLEDLIPEGDKVVVRSTVRGTHRGEGLGLAPTGKQVTMTGIDFFRIVVPEDRVNEGRVGEVWLEIDAMGGMQQMGVVPELGIGPLGFTRYFLRTLARFALAQLRTGLRRPGNR